MVDVVDVFADLEVRQVVAASKSTSSRSTPLSPARPGDKPCKVNPG